MLSPLVYPTCVFTTTGIVPELRLDASEASRCERRLLLDHGFLPLILPTLQVPPPPNVRLLNSQFFPIYG
jgi:hypothetical protein